MTVATNVSRADFTITTGTTEYPFTFRIFEDTDLVVILRATDGTVSTLVLNTDYTVDGVGDYNGGKVIVSSQFASDNDGAQLVVRRVLDLVQETSIRNQGKFYPETHENVFDRLTMIDQQQQEQINRSLKYPPAGSSGMSTDLPAPDPGKGLKWNATGDGLENTQHDADAIANIAAQYASQAAQSASDAAESAQDASDTYDDFRGTYYGPLSSDPSTDPLGNPPNQGDMYFNTTTNRLRVYSASGAWIEGAGGSMQTFPLTGDGIETTFPLPATPPNTDYADVYIDGVYQQKDTYSFVGGAIVFNDPPPAPANPGDHNIEVRVIEVLPLGVTDASLVKYTPDDGGPEMTVEQALDDARANLADIDLKLSGFVNVKEFGAVGDGVADDTAAVQAALDSGADRIHFPAGRYVINGDVTRTRSVVITGDGTNTVLDFSGGTGQLLITGSLTPLDKLSVSPSRHMRELTWSTAQGLSARDVVILWNPTDYSWGGRRAYYRDGAMFRIHSMTSPTVASTYDPCPDAYNAASMNVYKMNYVQAVVKDISCIASGSVEKAPLTLRHCVDSSVEGYSYFGGIYAGVVLDRCYNVSVYDSAPINASPHDNNEYGIVVSNSTHVSISGKGAFASRHSVAIGGTDLEATVPNRYVSVSGMSLLNNSANTNSGDVHGNSDYVTYDNCFFISGCSVGGRNLSIRNSTIIGETGGAFADRKAIYGTEVNGGTLSIENVTIQTTGDGNVTGFIHINVLGIGEGAAEATGMRETLRVLVRNVTIVAPNAVSNAKAVFINGQNANLAVSVHIDGLTVQAPALLAFLFARDVLSPTLLSNFLIVDNVYGPAGAYLIYPDASIAAVSTREMAQRGWATLGVPSNDASAIDAGQSFRYKYSRRPSVSVSYSGVNGAAKQVVGGKEVRPIVYSYTADLIRMGVRTCDGANFTSTDSVQVHYTAGVQDV